MTKAVFEYSDDEWLALTEATKADAWALTGAGFARAIERFDVDAPDATTLWGPLINALNEAIRNRERLLMKAQNKRRMAELSAGSTSSSGVDARKKPR
jgi:hypothetical protein